MQSFGECYIPMISGWYRTQKNEPITGGYPKHKLVMDGYKKDAGLQGGCCDNDVHEHFKCLEETVLGKIFVNVYEDKVTVYGGTVSRKKVDGSNTYGTGGAIQCGNLDLFEVMRFAAMDARTKGGDTTAMPAPAVLMMATTCGARAQGRAEECGMLKEGMDADIVLVDFSAPHLMPCHNVMNGLVFSAKGGDVAMTMVRGNILYQNGTFPTIDLKAVVEDLTGYAIGRLFSEKE